MKKESRTYLMYLEDMMLAMDRIAEYIEGYSFIKFKQNSEMSVVHALASCAAVSSA